jgi:hypothetical protein
MNLHQFQALACSIAQGDSERTMGSLHRAKRSEGFAEEKLIFSQHICVCYHLPVVIMSTDQTISTKLQKLTFKALSVDFETIGRPHVEAEPCLVDYVIEVTDIVINKLTRGSVYVSEADIDTFISQAPDSIGNGVCENMQHLLYSGKVDSRELFKYAFMLARHYVHLGKLKFTTDKALDHFVALLCNIRAELCCAGCQLAGYGEPDEDEDYKEYAYPLEKSHVMRYWDHDPAFKQWIFGLQTQDTIDDDEIPPLEPLDSDIINSMSTMSVNPEPVVEVGKSSQTHMSIDDLLAAHNKDQLYNMAIDHGCKVYKSWTKQKIAEVLEKKLSYIHRNSIN